MRSLLPVILAVATALDLRAATKAAVKPAAKAVPATTATRWFTDYATHPVKWQRWSGQGSTSQAKPLLVVTGEVGCLPCRETMRTFADAQLAAMVNARFVPLLVDGVERGELVDAYTAVFEQTVAHEPVILVMTPDLLPLAMIGAGARDALLHDLTAIADRWGGAKEDMLAESRTLMARAYLRAEQVPAAAVPDGNTIATRLAADYDAERSAFDALRPETARLLPLLRIASRTGSARAEEIGPLAIRRILSSGMYDPVGGGVFRAAVDRDWRVPEFEKDLRDQLLFGDALLEAWRLTRRDEYRDALVDTLDFMIAEMQLPDGGFTHAIDSESLHPRGEPRLLHGIFYAWQLPELQRLLGNAVASRVAATFGMTAGGNVPSELDASGSLVGWNLPLRVHPLPADPEFRKALQQMRRVRNVRPRPAAELSSTGAMNGAAASLLARAARLLVEPRYLEAASRAATTAARSRDARTKTFRHMPGSDVPATVDDLALMAIGDLDLYEATGDVRWLDQSLLAMTSLESLWDAAAGRYRSGAAVPEPVRPLLREESATGFTQHGAAALALLRLGDLSGNPQWQARGAALIAKRGAVMHEPRRDPLLLLAADRLEAKMGRVAVIVGPRGAPATEAFVAAVNGTNLPYASLVYFSSARSRAELAKRLPWVASVEIPAEPVVAVAYVCRNGSCSSAIADPATLAAQLQ